MEGGRQLMRVHLRLHVVDLGGCQKIPGQAPVSTIWQPAEAL